MKLLLTLCLTALTGLAGAQNDLRSKYIFARGLLETRNFRGAYRVLQELEPLCQPKDSLYPEIIWYSVAAGFQVEKEMRDHQQFDSSARLGLELLKLIEKGEPHFDEKFASRKYWIYKDLTVSYFGLGELGKSNAYKAKLYEAYRENLLPEGIDKYFNFHFFKWKDKNVWGYEWYEELPEDRMSRSFTKVVYYVYSTNPDGSDKDQLYRLHVLMFHKLDSSTRFDYVLTQYLENDGAEVSRTLYGYTYNKDIDYKKLQADVREVLAGKPATRKFIESR